MASNCPVSRLESKSSRKNMDLKIKICACQCQRLWTHREVSEVCVESQGYRNVMENETLKFYVSLVLEIHFVFLHRAPHDDSFTSYGKSNVTGSNMDPEWRCGNLSVLHVAGSNRSTRPVGWSFPRFECENPMGFPGGRPVHLGFSDKTHSPKMPAAKHQLRTASPLVIQTSH